MFKRVLIANRGEIAIRIARAAASLGVDSVAIFTKADSMSLHTKLTGAAREISGASCSVPRNPWASALSRAPAIAGAAGSSNGAPDALGPIHELLPGLGEPTPLRITAESPAVGRSLAELDLRGQTGATVLVILRGEQGLLPSAREVLREGDVLALAGSHDAIESARALLVPTPR